MKRGFTLVELLIAVAIVAVLSAVALSVYSTIQISNRDQRRWRDLNNIKQALEIYNHDNHYYPSALIDLVTANYLDSYTDAYDSRRHPALVSSSASYVICAKMENPDRFPVPPPGCVGATGPDCGSGAGSCNVGIVSP